jgi:diguanylate cyclase (GGDEF)-like protein
MIFKSPVMRLSFVLMLFTINLFFLAEWIGLVPDSSASLMELRKSLSESLALQFTHAVEKSDFQSIQTTLRAVVERNDDVRSAAIRTHDGRLIALAGEHLAFWKPSVDGKSTPTHVHVPVFRNGEDWATVEIRFAPLWTDNLTGGFTHSFMGLLAFISLSGFVCSFFVIKRTLRELDPSAVIPERVQKAFDVLQEGVLILDEKEQIVMSNLSFAALFDKTPSAMIGLKGSELGWIDCQTPKDVKQLPWFRVVQAGEEQHSASLSLMDSTGKKIQFAVNAASVTDGHGKCRGTLVTFDDITLVEEKNFELSEMVDKLQMANEEIKAKSQELEILAHYDPLTLCLNRRSFAQKFDALFTRSKSSGANLSCMMVDIDFFKSVNDRYGHATGDQVIKAVADVLKTSTRDTDLVSRYGGEEFCVVMPGIPLDRALQIAERIRRTIENESCAGVSITVSQGVSSLDQNSGNPDELVNQADKALYTAKESGRNRVVPWGKDSTPIVEGDAAAKTPKHALPSQNSSRKELSLDQLQRRVMELEGLLKKRTIELEHYEMYDFKSGLPTRALFEDRIGHEIARAKRKGHLVTVLSIAINTITRVNETLGYRAAEQLVKACGQRLNDVLRENIDMVAVIDNFKGTSTVSLMNQTDFGILLTDIQQVEHVTWVMKRLLNSFEKPFQIKGNEIYVSAYLGVSIFPHDGKTVDDLYSSATNACRYAQTLKENDRYYFSSPSLNERAVSQLRIENSLHEAIRKDEFKLYYQPKIEGATGRIAGFETLLRWRSARLGAVSPAEFIPVAEQSGQINTIGRWVLYNACRQLRAWMDMGLAAKPVAVNMSGSQLRQQNLPVQIRSILDEFSIPTHLLEIELTESSLVNTHDKSFTVLSQIKEMGVRVTMDDFGTGYSSLSYLRNIPLSCLKIDRSFVSDIHKDGNADKLIASIVSMAKALELEVVAEGVEEKYQADYLIALKCQYLQGYYFSRPIPQEEVVALLQNQPLALAG